MADMQITAK